MSGHLAVPKMQLVKRDPFARSELMKERVYETLDVVLGCRECEQYHKTPKSGKRYLFRFWEVSDGGRSTPYSGMFCSYGCFRIHHNA